MVEEIENYVALNNEFNKLNQLSSLQDQRTELIAMRTSLEEDKSRLLNIIKRYKECLSQTTKLELIKVIAIIDGDIDNTNIFINDVENDRQKILNE